MVKDSYWFWDGVVDKKLCDYFLSNLDWEASSPASFANSTSFVAYDIGSVDKEVRETDVIFADELSPVTAMLHNFILYANSAAGWNFSINKFQPAQLGRYKSGGHFTWHIDTAPPDADNTQRKLSAVLLLNDGSEYEGGELELDVGGNQAPIKTAGSVVVFPSFVRHRVAPVISGVRYSAVCWALGPSFT
jgi:PKHD-type hydroxylase